MSELVTTIVDPDPASLAGTAEQFLIELGGPTEILVTGRDRSRWRVLIVLMHGNEPSGPIAAWRWLRSGARPAVDISIFVLAVDAATEPPGFAHRMLPGKRDLNRCFVPPFDDDNGKLAREVLRRIRRRPCEALIDIHNNTGLNPAYGIINRPGLDRLKLVELFTNSCCILSDLNIGALTEVIVDDISSVAIECGHSRDPAAHDVALAGIERFVNTQDLELDTELNRDISLFDHPIRVRLRNGLTVRFSDQPDPTYDLTLRADIDNHNFHTLDPGTVLGWIQPGCAWPLVALGADQKDVSHLHFAISDDKLIFTTDRVPVMMTTDPIVARQDCLCYLMHVHDWLADLTGPDTP
ncbi:MAG: succinylglutamate desuccinylase [Proteobacteria bacterium]|nr:succinylglutamate desuccinylase [Pseudomonadota bacterium]